jgi:predicted O-methyltransferase YrrM
MTDVIMKLKEFILLRLGVIIRVSKDEQLTYTELLYDSLKFENRHSIYHNQAITWLLFANLFSHEIVINNYKHKKEEIQKGVQGLLDWERKLKKYNLASSEGSMITYKGKSNKLLHAKPANLVWAIKKVSEQFKKPEMLEIGFNLGFGAHCFLSNSANLAYTGIDINEHSDVMAASSLILENFPNHKIKFQWGPSCDILPQYVNINKEFQIIHIDGSHKLDDVRIDLSFCDKLLELGGVLILDDIAGDGVAAALYEWADKNRYKMLEEQEYVGLHPHLILQKYN